MLYYYFRVGSGTVRVACAIRLKYFVSKINILASYSCMLAERLAWHYKCLAMSLASYSFNFSLSSCPCIAGEVWLLYKSTYYFTLQVNFGGAGDVYHINAQIKTLKCLTDIMSIQSERLAS